MSHRNHLTPGLKERVLGAERETAGRRRDIYAEARRMQQETIARVGRDLEDLAWFYDVNVHFGRTRTSATRAFPTAAEASMSHGHRNYLDYFTLESIARTHAELSTIKTKLLALVGKVEAVESGLSALSYIVSSPPEVRRRVRPDGTVHYEEVK